MHNLSKVHTSSNRNFFKVKHKIPKEFMWYLPQEELHRYPRKKGTDTGLCNVPSILFFMLVTTAGKILPPERTQQVRPKIVSLVPLQWQVVSSL